MGAGAVTASINTAPSEAQKAAGNYAKGHLSIHGLGVTVENPKGSKRSGVDRGGKPWSVTMPADYGYIKRTEGADGDHIDAYIGPHRSSPRVYVIDQKDAESGRFDEHKTFIGFANENQVRRTYEKAFSDGKAKQRMGHLREMTVAEFKDWINDGDTTKPVRKYADGGQVGPVPESRATLLEQQRQLINGDRDVQMFPAGHPELTLPRGFQRMKVGGNVFHYNKKKMTPKKIVSASKAKRENELLGLGPISKEDALSRAAKGENPVAVVERTRDGVEARAAAGTHKTAAAQLEAMNAVKSADNVVDVEHPAETISKRFADGGMADGGAPDLPDAPWAAKPDSAALPDAPWATKSDPGIVENTRQRVASEISGVRAAAPSIVPEFVGPVPAKTLAGAARLAANYVTGADAGAVQDYEHGKAAPAPEPIDIATKAIANIPSSGAKFIGDIVHPVIHPVETATGLKNLGLGVAEKTGLTSGKEHVQYADAVGKFFADRYGGVDNLKKTMAEDPVGFAGDLSMILSGGASVPARAPGVVGRTAKAIGDVGRAVDPLSPIAGVAKAIGSGAADVIGGLGTHTGGESLKLAARAGAEGGEAARTFQENMRGFAPMDDAVAEARNALGVIRKQRGEVYRENMKSVASDPTVLDFNKIDDALVDISSVKNYKGQNLSPSTQAIRHEIGTAVKDWKALDPAEFHTVEGMDALKQKIGDIRDATQYGTPDRVVADRAYHAIRNTIIAQAPEYAKVMKGYEEASKQIKEIEKTLSLNPKASVDTALRKLQSVLRNNVNANYGQRAKLAEVLVEAGAPNLMHKLAGQALSSGTPRGLGKLGMQLGAEIAALTAGHAAFGLPGLAIGAATLPMMSPRLMGEAAYYAGKGSSALPLRTGAQSSFQVGRETEPALGRP